MQDEIEVTGEGMKWQAAVSRARGDARHTYLTVNGLRVAVVAPLTLNGTAAPDAAEAAAALLTELAAMSTDAERQPGWTAEDHQAAHAEDTATLDGLILRAREITGGFERYTDRARRVLDIAADEARNLGLVRVGAGHLLLGLIGEDGGVAAVALKSLGADLGEARHTMGRGAIHGVQPPPGPIPFTSRARGVLDQAATEAAALGSPYIGTEHLLLALISDSEGNGNDLLVAIGINPGDARAKVMELLCGYEEDGKRPLAPAGGDLISAALEEIRERQRFASDRSWRQIDEKHEALIKSCYEDVPRLLAAVDAVLKRHSRPEKPSHCYDLDLRCATHDWTKNTVHPFGVVLDCPDCTYRDRWYCTCCDHDEWPCPTVQDITRALTGGGADGG